MSREARKYAREEAARQDTSQLSFSKNGSALQSRPRMIIERSTVDFSRRVFCPFCLHTGAIQEFLVSTKKGISQGKAQCPECSAGMLMRSLLTVWTPESYADWVFEYARSGFWQKCKFGVWKERLNAMGWSREFWDRYKVLKGPDENESGREWENAY